MENILVYIIDDLEDCNKDLRYFLKYLKEDDLQKYSNYKSLVKKKSFLVGRLLLQMILYENFSVSIVELVQNEYGKLFLRSNKEKINFNLSYTEGTVACALAQRVQIGVDIEKEKETSNDYTSEIANIIFKPSEAYFIQNQNSIKDKSRAFFYLWTRKEAFMKLEGKGFSLDPLSFCVLEDRINWKREVTRFETISLKSDCLLSLAYKSADRRKFQIINISYEQVISYFTNL